MTIAEFDHLNTEQKKKLLFQCCASTAWVEKMLSIPPAEDLIDLFEDAEECWYSLTEQDWREAFSNHPRMDHLESSNRSLPNDQFKENAPTSVQQASAQTLNALAEGNKMYEEKFGYNFIVSERGKSAVEMLGMLTARLQNKPEDEIKIAMEEQSKITRLRLQESFDA